MDVVPSRRVLAPRNGKNLRSFKAGSKAATNSTAAKENDPREVQEKLPVKTGKLGGYSKTSKENRSLIARQAKRKASNEDDRISKAKKVVVVNKVVPNVQHPVVPKLDIVQKPVRLFSCVV